MNILTFPRRRRLLRLIWAPQDSFPTVRVFVTPERWSINNNLATSSGAAIKFKANRGPAATANWANGHKLDNFVHMPSVGCLLLNWIYYGHLSPSQRERGSEDEEGRNIHHINKRRRPTDWDAGYYSSSPGVPSSGALTRNAAADMEVVVVVGRGIINKQTKFPSYFGHLILCVLVKATGRLIGAPQRTPRGELSSGNPINAPLSAARKFN